MKYLFEGLGGDIYRAARACFCWFIHSWFWWRERGEDADTRFECSICGERWYSQELIPWD